MKRRAAWPILLFPIAGWAEPLVFEGGGQRLELEVLETEAVFMHGVPSLQIALDEKGAEAISDLTGSMIGERLSVSLCGTVLIEATIHERIDSGRAMVNMPNIETAMAAADVMEGDANCADLETKTGD